MVDEYDNSSANNSLPQLYQNCLEIIFRNEVGFFFHRSADTIACFTNKTITP